MKVLDTNHLAELEENSAAGRLLRTRLKTQTDPLATTIITVEEHLRGWLALLNRSNELLANSFSFLPILYDGKWQLIADFEMMRFLRKPSDLSKNDRLSMSLGTTIKEESIRLISAKTCAPSDTIVYLTEIIENLPVLVIQKFDGEPKLLGVVTPFDLL